jgi:hypothetical protein
MMRLIDKRCVPVFVKVTLCGVLDGAPSLVEGGGRRM